MDSEWIFDSLFIQGNEWKCLQIILPKIPWRKPNRIRSAPNLNKIVPFRVQERSHWTRECLHRHQRALAPPLGPLSAPSGLVLVTCSYVTPYASMQCFSGITNSAQRGRLGRICLDIRSKTSVRSSRFLQKQALWRAELRSETFRADFHSLITWWQTQCWGQSSRIEHLDSLVNAASGLSCQHSPRRFWSNVDAQYRFTPSHELNDVMMWDRKILRAVSSEPKGSALPQCWGLELRDAKAFSWYLCKMWRDLTTQILQTLYSHSLKDKSVP